MDDGAEDRRRGPGFGSGRLNSLRRFPYRRSNRPIGKEARYITIRRGTWSLSIRNLDGARVLGARAGNWQVRSYPPQIDFLPMRIGTGQPAHGRDFRWQPATRASHRNRRHRRCPRKARGAVIPAKYDGSWVNTLLPHGRSASGNQPPAQWPTATTPSGWPASICTHRRGLRMLTEQSVFAIVRLTGGASLRNSIG